MVELVRAKEVKKSISIEDYHLHARDFISDETDRHYCILDGLLLATYGIF